MNVLFWIGLGLLVLIAIGFLVGLHKNSVGLSTICFVLAFILCCGVLILNGLPARQEVWNITNIQGSNISMFNSSGNNTTVNINKLPHMDTVYEVGQEVMILRDYMGNVEMFAPNGWIVPTK